MNPVLPLDVFVPDGEARVWPDGRLYLYGSLDVAGRNSYCSSAYRVFSTDDLESWVDHGVSFQSGMAHGESDRVLFAPDVVLANGQYRLFYCDDHGGEGVAVSATPQGPFHHARALPLADGDGIDPAVLVDDDGAVYYFWGQFQLRGARMAPDLVSLDPATVTRDVLTEEQHGFHEGASIRKIRGTYYMVYTDISRGRASCLSHATSTHPLGPYEKRGVIIDNTGCDPASWNNHGSIAEFRGHWYVFYHRSSRGTKFHRRACVEPIAIAPDGTIPEVPMTTQGASPALEATRELDAGRACQLSGHVRVAPVTDGGAEECLTGIRHGDTAVYRYLEFPEACRGLDVCVSGGESPVRIDVMRDGPHGTLLGSGDVRPTPGSATREWQRIPGDVSIRGRRAVALRFVGENGVFPDLHAIRFVSRKGGP